MLKIVKIFLFVSLSFFIAFFTGCNSPKTVKLELKDSENNNVVKDVDVSVNGEKTNFKWDKSNLLELEKQFEEDSYLSIEVRKNDYYAYQLLKVSGDENLLKFSNVPPDISQKAQPRIFIDGKLNFIVKDNDNSASKRPAIENIGTGQLRISNIKITGKNKNNFSILNEIEYPLIIEEGGKYNLIIEFSKSSKSSKSKRAVLRISSNDIDNQITNVELIAKATKKSAPAVVTNEPKPKPKPKPKEEKVPVESPKNIVVWINGLDVGKQIDFGNVDEETTVKKMLTILHLEKETLDLELKLSDPKNVFKIKNTKAQKVTITEGANIEMELSFTVPSDLEDDTEFTGVLTIYYKGNIEKEIKIKGKGIAGGLF